MFKWFELYSRWVPLRSALGKTAMLRRLPFPYYGSITIVD